ncbi:fibronectin type III domain-containing protein [Marinobacter sp. SS21]|uniref:fibronectin type III domain-containing protein n=1 Tax=Marinobacter sp. SS21 TaxID=2979460 RepID=UPI00232D2A81|nr:fibronectin type III domain-containing protein [Marinobacter sp. SS21]MDC0661412.1 fibronectin type III domain-containing protein [Marinobacter sp. SS21]
MSIFDNKLAKHGLWVLPAVALLTGCGGGGDGSDASAPGSTEATVDIAGAAVKGVIQQGLVSAKRLVADKNGHYRPQRQSTKPVRTAADGSYELQLRGKADGWALVELVADSDTRMICDVVPQCDQAGAAPVAFGQPLPLDHNFVLSGAGDLTTETVYLTPLTHMAVTLAERSGNGLSAEALSSAYATVEDWFGLSAGALRLAPPDLTRLDDMSDVSADAMQVAIANAAFLALVNDNPQWHSISDVLNDMTVQVTDTGRLSVTGDGTDVALADLVTAAAIQASELQTLAESSLVSQKLAVVESRNVQRFQTLADVYGDTNTDVADSGDSTDDTTNDSSTGGGSADNSVPANAALLSWTAPLTRVDGESLAMGEIAGFEVAYGINAENLDQTLAIGDGSVDELLVDELTTGTWYFAIRTLDTEGNRSELSEVVYKQI